LFVATTQSKVLTNRDGSLSQLNIRLIRGCPFAAVARLGHNAGKVIGIVNTDRYLPAHGV